MDRDAVEIDVNDKETLEIDNGVEVGIVDDTVAPDEVASDNNDAVENSNFAAGNVHPTRSKTKIMFDIDQAHQADELIPYISESNPRVDDDYIVVL